jgi:hypothetical protein
MSVYTTTYQQRSESQPKTTAYDTRETFFEPKYGFYASPEWKSMKGGAQHVSQTIAENWETMPYEEKLARTGVQFGVSWIVGGPLLSGSSMFSQVARVGIQQTGNFMVAKTVAEKGPIELLQPENLLWTAASTVSPLAKTSPIHYGEAPGWKGLYTYGERPIYPKVVPENVAKEITPGYTPVTKIETKITTSPAVTEKLGFTAEDIELSAISKRSASFSQDVKVPREYITEPSTEIKALPPEGVKATMGVSKANLKDVEMHYGSHTTEAQLMPEFREQFGKPGDIDKMLKITEPKAAEVFAGKELAAQQRAGVEVRQSPENPMLIEAKGEAGGKEWVHAIDIHYPGEPSASGPAPEGSYGYRYGNAPIKLKGGTPAMPLKEQVHRMAGSVGSFQEGKIGPASHRIKDVRRFPILLQQAAEYKKMAPLGALKRGQIAQAERDVVRFKEIWGARGVDFNQPTTLEPTRPSARMSSNRPSSAVALPSRSAYAYPRTKSPSLSPSHSLSLSPSISPSMSASPSISPSASPSYGFSPRSYSPRLSKSPSPASVSRSLSPSPSLTASLMFGKKNRFPNLGLTTEGGKKQISWKMPSLKMENVYRPSATANVFDIRGKQPKIITGFEYARPKTGRRKHGRKRK